ncbi:hypothetical protein ACH5RR_026145 [Cinchona calisaya]|uniref:Uncharacterized protein n=1 Tax=Cinchona calisaya TaxID=153742 RepID=A0ABD2Z2U1_9GENT
MSMIPICPKASVHRSLPNDCRRFLELTYPSSSSCYAGVREECYLVDPASSHMLVSKIKPCMYKRSMRTLPVAVMIHDNLTDRTIIVIVGLQRGISSKCKSSARIDYIPTLCAHHPSLQPIEWSGVVFELRRCGLFAARNIARSPLNLTFSGRRSRNKVSVGEPAEGSLSNPTEQTTVNSYNHTGSRVAAGETPRRPCGSPRAGRVE